MTEEEFERLQRRFGTDVSAWPAPHRREGLAHLAGEDAASDADDALDRLILYAAQAETDEHALARKVLARIAGERHPSVSIMSSGFWRMWTMPAAASGFAAVLLVAAVAGYMAAERRGLDATDDAFMALALGGDGDLGGGGILDALGPGEEGAL